MTPLTSHDPIHHSPLTTHDSTPPPSFTSKIFSSAGEISFAALLQCYAALHFQSAYFPVFTVATHKTVFTDGMDAGIKPVIDSLNLPAIFSAVSKMFLPVVFIVVSLP